MKQLALTPEIISQIKAAVGEDVDPTGFAVFEAIALNTQPLPGKRGSIFENAVVPPLTLSQMADAINGGNHLPLIFNHSMNGTPTGRVFAGAIDYNDAGAIELRVLFYVDPTETQLIAKLNAGSVDEVSVQFLSSQLLCSACGWDYRGPDSNSEFLWSRTCKNGHEIGVGGTHLELLGLDQFIELSLVTRGAADKAKIVGKSQSKLQPATAMRLAARGFEVDGLVVSAALGEELVTVDTTKLISDLTDAKSSAAVLTAANTTLTAGLETANASVADLTTKLEAANGEIATLRAAAEATPPEKTELVEAVAFLSETYTKILTAAGKEVPAELPKTVAELKSVIMESTAQLTAILPVGGVADTGKETDKGAPVIVASAFSARKRMTDR